MTAKLAFEAELSGTEVPEAPHVCAAPTTPALPLGDAARAWLQRKREAKRKDGSARRAPSTTNRYTHAVEKMIAPYIGEIDARAVTRAELVEWRDHLGEHYAAATVNGALTVLRMVLRDEVDSAIGDKVAALEEDDTRITEDEPNALTEAELQAFIAALRATNPQHVALVLLMFTTGARISTAIALEREDLEPERGVVVFRRRLSEGVVLPGVKRSRKARDEAPLHPEVWRELQRHIAQMGELELESGLVFPTPEGRHHDRGVLRRAFARALELAGIEKRFTPHGCRRTASAMLRRAAGSVVTKAIVGHTTDAMHEHYAIVDSTEKSAASRAAFKVIEGGQRGAPSEKRGLAGTKRGLEGEAVVGEGS